MGSFDYTVQTTASPTTALAYLADLHHLEEFIEEVTGVEREGDRWVVSVSRVPPLPDMKVEYTVTSDAGSVVASGTHSALDVTDAWEVRAADGATEVRYHGTYELKGPRKIAAPLADLLERWRAPEIAKRLGERLDSLPTG